MSAPKWQEITDQMWGEETAPEPEIEALEPVQTWEYKEKPKRKSLHEKYGDSVLYGVLTNPIMWISIALILAFTALALNEQWRNEFASCQSFVTRRIADIPARCLAELSEMKPR